MPLGESKNAPAITPVVFRNSRRDFAKSFIEFSLEESLPSVRCSLFDQSCNFRRPGDDVSQRIGQGPDSRSQQHNILDQELARRRREGGKFIPCPPYSWRRNDKTQGS